MRRWRPEFAFLVILACSMAGTVVGVMAQTATPGAPVLPAGGADTPVLPLGLPVSVWVAIVLGGGGGAIVGKGLLEMFNSLVAVIRGFSSDYPERLKAGRAREEADTSNVKEQVEILKTMHEGIKEREAALLEMQKNATGMALVQTNLLATAAKQSDLITDLQRAQFAQQTQHALEMEKMAGKIEKMENDGKITLQELLDARKDALTWKEKYNAEHERAEALAAKLKQYETGDHPAVAVVEELLPTSDDLPSSTALTPGVPTN